MLPYAAQILALSAGAVAGGFLRFTLLNVMGTQVGLLFINSAGGLIAGFCLGFFPASEALRLFLFIGFLGAFTTLSGLAIEFILIFQTGNYAKALGMLVIHNIMAITLAIVGFELGKFLKFSL